MNESARQRALQPLEPRAIGVVADEVLVVHANWDRFEVRTAADRMVVAGAPEAWLFEKFYFVAHRFLVCTVGGGVSVHEVRTYDFANRDWLAPIPMGGGELGIIGVDPLRPFVAVKASSPRAEAVAVWNVATGAREGTLTGVDPEAAAFHPTRPLLALGDQRDVMIVDWSGRVVSGARLGGERVGDLTSLVWATEARLVSTGMDWHVRFWDALPLARVNEVAIAASDAPRLSATPRVISAPGGAHVLALLDGSGYLIDPATYEVRHEPDVRAACFDRSSDLLVVGANGVRRVVL